MNLHRFPILSGNANALRIKKLHRPECFFCFLCYSRVRCGATAAGGQCA